MVDIGEKAATHRVAIAEGWIVMQAATLEKIRHGHHKKGDVLGIARIAGIMAAKKTADLIPLCHPLALTRVDITLTPQQIPPAPDTPQILTPNISLNFSPENRFAIHCSVQAETHGQTGVEMEALTAVHITLLTIYDMCKAVDKGMQMENIRLVYKAGGKSGNWEQASVVSS